MRFKITFVSVCLGFFFSTKNGVFGLEDSGWIGSWVFLVSDVDRGRKIERSFW